MDVKLEGLANVTEFRAMHPEKALCPIEVNEDGLAKTTETRTMHRTNTPLPMEVTPDGTDTEVRELHP